MEQRKTKNHWFYDNHSKRNFFLSLNKYFSLYSLGSMAVKLIYIQTIGEMQSFDGFSFFSVSLLPKIMKMNNKDRQKLQNQNKFKIFRVWF